MVTLSHLRADYSLTKKDRINYGLYLTTKKAICQGNRKKFLIFLKQTSLFHDFSSQFSAFFTQWQEFFDKIKINPSFFFIFMFLCKILLTYRWGCVIIYNVKKVSNFSASHLSTKNESLKWHLFALFISITCISIYFISIKAILNIFIYH